MEQFGKFKLFSAVTDLIDKIVDFGLTLVKVVDSRLKWYIFSLKWFIFAYFEKPGPKILHLTLLSNNFISIKKSWSTLKGFETR